jgi:hypothetical protein
MESEHGDSRLGPTPQPEPRDWHWAFAHTALREIVFEQTDKLLAGLANPARIDGVPAAVMRRVAQVLSVPEADLAAHAGGIRVHLRLGGHFAGVPLRDARANGPHRGALGGGGQPVHPHTAHGVLHAGGCAGRRHRLVQLGRGGRPPQPWQRPRRRRWTISWRNWWCAFSRRACPTPTGQTLPRPPLKRWTAPSAATTSAATTCWRCWSAPALMSPRQARAAF